MRNDLLTTKVLPQFILTMVFSLIGMACGKVFIPPRIASMMSVIVFVVLLLVLLIKLISKKRTFRLSMPVVHLITFIMGISIYPAIDYYVGSIGANLVMAAFGITMVLFAALTIYAYTSKKDFLSLGPILFSALLALILVSLLNMFLKIALLKCMITYIGIIIFSGYILYDISVIKSKDFAEEDVPLAVLNLYFDFINLFLRILEVIDSFR